MCHGLLVKKHPSPLLGSAQAILALVVGRNGVRLLHGPCSMVRWACRSSRRAEVSRGKLGIRRQRLGDWSVNPPKNKDPQVGDNLVGSEIHQCREPWRRRMMNWEMIRVRPGESSTSDLTMQSANLAKATVGNFLAGCLGLSTILCRTLEKTDPVRRTNREHATLEENFINSDEAEGVHRRIKKI
ncbi:uncharacterized protein BJX67DRAFT_175163 [Aspergillus lucknowensis]|uniref:Uncharacterized protein n=1 Tax=Aspergillus lucknowensis TaxID=176173 RepID=A0ABR4LLR8_9EURO